MAKTGTGRAKPKTKTVGAKRPSPKKRAAARGDQSRKESGKPASAKTASRSPGPTRPRAGTPRKHVEATVHDGHGYTLKDRVRRAEQHREPAPTLVESEAVGFMLSDPGLLEEVREEAFVELAGVVERKLAVHGHRLTRFEAANVAWRILGR
jgi:hypothetical protein